MKLCHSEIIKRIRELESKKSMLLTQERNRCTYTYTDENNKIVPKYSYSKTREAVDSIDTKIRKLRNALAYANCTVKVEGFDITLGESLVLLAQLQGKYGVLESLASRDQLTQRSSYMGRTEYIACNYDVEVVNSELDALQAEISSLQIAIDRANLVNYVEVDI